MSKSNGFLVLDFLELLNCLILRALQKRTLDVISGNSCLVLSFLFEILCWVWHYYFGQLCSSCSRMIFQCASNAPASHLTQCSYSHIPESNKTSSSFIENATLTISHCRIKHSSYSFPYTHWVELRRLGGFLTPAPLSTQ